MTNPFTAGLRAELAAARQALADAKEREAYWRTRYERLADAALFKAGEIRSPVHVEATKADTSTSLSSRIMRAANASGADYGVRAPHGLILETVDR